MNRALLVISLIFPPLAYADEAEDESNIPDGPRVGVGIGIRAPTDSLAPNVASVRIRAKDGFDLEPEIGLHLRHAGYQGAEELDLGRSGSRTAYFGLDGRFRVARRGDLELMAIARLVGGAYAIRTEAPGSPDTTNRGTHGALGWGLGAQWWASPRLCLSGDLRSEVFSVGRGQTVIDGGEPSATSTSFNASLALQPSARVMAHVMF